MLQRKLQVAGMLGVLLMLSACATQNALAPSPPPTPQVTMAASVKVLASGLDLAVTALIEARNHGRLTLVELTAANQVAGAMARAGKQIDAVLRSADAWPVQQTKILAIVVGVSVRQGAAALPPTATAILQASVAIWNQMAQTVGGPTI